MTITPTQNQALAQAALLIIDVQQGLDDPQWGPRNNPQAEQHIAQLIARWREMKRPLLHVQHASTSPTSPLRPELPGFAIKPEATPLPDEPLFQKSVNSAFIDTAVEAYLRERGLDTLLIVGLTTDHCVSTSVRMAGNLGFTVFLAGDATATFACTGPDGRQYSADAMHDIHLASLHGEFCTVISTEEAINA